MDFLSKSAGLNLLRKYDLPVIDYFFETEQIPNYENYSIRSSILKREKRPNIFHGINCSMPGSFFVKKEDLKKEIDNIRNLCSRDFGEDFEIIIHETKSIRYSGNLLINKISGIVILEGWDSYNKKEIPVFSEEKKFNADLAFQGITIDKNIYKLPFSEYLLEWTLTTDNEFLFTELSVIA